MAFDTVANQQLADVATATFKGRATAGTGSPEDLTVAQVNTLLGAAQYTPTDLDIGETFTIPEGRQVLWANCITVNGTLNINGALRGVR